MTKKRRGGGRRREGVGCCFTDYFTYYFNRDVPIVAADASAGARRDESTDASRHGIIFFLLPWMLFILAAAST